MFGLHLPTMENMPQAAAVQEHHDGFSIQQEVNLAPPEDLLSVQETK